MKNIVEIVFITTSSLLFFFLLWLGLKEYEHVKMRKKLKMGGNLWGGLEQALGSLNKKKFNYSFERLEKRIRQAGNPYNMTVTKYWFAKILLTIAALFYAIYAEFDLIIAAILMIAVFLLPDILLISKRRDRVVAFKQELPEVLDTIELGVTADVPLNEVFLLAADTVEGKELKKELLHFSANYFVTKDRAKSLDGFTQAIGLPEVKILSMALMQVEKTGRSRDIVASLSGGMFNTTVAKVNRDEKAVEYKVLFALFILMASSVMVYLQPYFSNLEFGLQNIF